ncbi:MAG: hypothetical protein CMJ76_13055 [Planctomycetaceae bacterium]|nr:hypothetical protein [Planctomycetaceae bacterium]
MSEQFDAYRVWLGIPPQQQPPNHYQLLGIGQFEADPDVIENAADRQMTHVRTYQSGSHSDDSQRILNEITQAKLCLLKPSSRAAYEAKLRAQTPLTSPTGEQAIPVSPVGSAHPGIAPMASPPAIPVAPTQPQAQPVRPAEIAIPVQVDNPTDYLPGIAHPDAKSVTRRARSRRGNAGIPWILIVGVLFGVGSIIAIGMIIMKTMGITTES